MKKIISTIIFAILISSNFAFADVFEGDLFPDFNSDLTETLYLGPKYKTCSYCDIDMIKSYLIYNNKKLNEIIEQKIGESVVSHFKSSQVFLENLEFLNWRLNDIKKASHHRYGHLYLKVKIDPSEYRTDTRYVNPYQDPKLYCELIKLTKITLIIQGYEAKHEFTTENRKVIRKWSVPDQLCKY